MDEAIKNFGKQFDFVPSIQNKEKINDFKRVIILGMGGSHLAGDVLKTIDSSLDITIHSDYGLPQISEELLKESLIVASSYSGNTEETLSGLNEAIKKGLSVGVLSVGGKLLEIAKEKLLPYIQIPDTKIQPRSALGFSLVSLAHLLNSKKTLSEIAEIKGKINPEEFEQGGKNLAEKIGNKIPLVYTSRNNFSIAYNWKIKLNETGKIPAFCNVFPELNHNEMTGFDSGSQTQKFAEQFFVIFHRDDEDHPKIQKRMDVVKELYEKKGIETTTLLLSGKNKTDKICRSLLLADWTAYYTALKNNAEPNEVLMVEEFKKNIG